ncbi:MAG: hypothetical protein ACT4OX_14910, partial [Actinomycetota bacterium]
SNPPPDHTPQPPLGYAASGGYRPHTPARHHSSPDKWIHTSVASDGLPVLTGIPWTRLQLANGKRLWVTALPGGRETKQVRSFTEDFEKCRRETAVVDDDRLAYADRFDAQPAPNWRWAAGYSIALLAWGVCTLTAIIVYPSLVVPVGLVYWIGMTAALVITRRRRPKRSVSS